MIVDPWPLFGREISHEGWIGASSMNLRTTQRCHFGRSSHSALLVAITQALQLSIDVTYMSMWNHTHSGASCFPKYALSCSFPLPEVFGLMVGFFLGPSGPLSRGWHGPLTHRSSHGRRDAGGSGSEGTEPTWKTQLKRAETYPVESQLILC